MTEATLGSPEHASGISRRSFLRDAAIAGGTLIGGPALLATGQLSSAAAAIATPKSGGVLQVGVSGGSSTDTLDAHKAGSVFSYATVLQLYDALGARDHNFTLVPALATEFIPTHKGKGMAVTLRPGVRFHNGKPLTAEDVVYTFRRILDPRIGADGLAVLQPIISDITAVDPLTVEFSFRFPFYYFQDFVSFAGNFGIVPVGYNPREPIGTGPFKYDTFVSGERATFKRNDAYWGQAVGFLGSHGPYVDAVVMTAITDDATRVSALTSGAVDAIDSLPAELLPQVRSDSSLAPLISPTANWNPITMRVDRPPFNDVRVRQAFRLIVDRPQMITDVYDGYARLGNDLYGLTDPLFDSGIPQRVQDIEKAKSLLKQAGREGVAVNLVTAPIIAGVVQSCVVFAEQAKAAGVNVQVTKLDNTSFFNNQYIQRTFSVDSWSEASLVAYMAYASVTGATWNEPHYNNPQFDKWYYQLVGTADQAARREIANAMQSQLWNEGGEIIFGFPDVIDAHTTKLVGLVPDQNGGSLSNWELKNAWFA